MNKTEIEKEILEIARLSGLLVEEIQWDQDLNQASLFKRVLDLEIKLEGLKKLLG